MLELGNATGHSIQAVLRGGYFPGAVTAPLFLLFADWMLSVAVDRLGSRSRLGLEKIREMFFPARHYGNEKAGNNTMNRTYIFVFLLVASNASASGLANMKGSASGSAKTASATAKGSSMATKSIAKNNATVLNSGTTLKTKGVPSGISAKNAVKSTATAPATSFNRGVRTTATSSFTRTAVRGNSLVVTNRAGHGYVQRRYSFRGQEIAHRTYFTNGVAHAAIYRPVVFRGVTVNAYVPSRYYSPAFYGWAYASWNRPFNFSFGFGSQPWIQANANYFTPSQSYGSASSFLTDDVIASSLQDAFQEAVDAGQVPAADSGTSPVTPAVKQAVSAEVQQQIAQENVQSATAVNSMPDAEASSIAGELNDGVAHVFVVFSNLTVPSAMGDCVITGGDVLQMNGATDQTNLISLVVLAGKSNDCQRGNTIFVQIADLQEMLNHMRETIDAGLADLQSRMGQAGFPAATPAAMSAPVQPAYAAIPLDTNVAAVLGSEAQQADATPQNDTNSTGNESESDQQAQPSKGKRVAHVLGNIVSVGATVADAAVK